MDKRSKTINNVAIWCTMALCGAGCAGCKPAPRAIDGRVTLAGEPLDEAAIVFVPLEPGRKKTGAQIVAGEYHLPKEDGLAPGTYRVEIIDNPPLGEPGVRSSRHAVARVTAESTRRVIPYAYAHDSPLSIVVGADSPTRFDFELKSQP